MKNEENKIELVQISIEEFKEKLQESYLAIFPAEERKPIALIEKFYHQGIIQLIKIVKKAEIIGFMTLNSIEPDGYGVLDYLAILPKYREKGFGAEAMKQFLDQENNRKGIYIEVDQEGLGKEDKENRIRERRTKFYERLGFRKLDFDLTLFSVIYTPYVYENLSNTDENIIEEILKIYETIIGKERIQKNCWFKKRKTR